jgi:hypothetical protein
MPNSSTELLPFRTSNQIRMYTEFLFSSCALRITPVPTSLFICSNNISRKFWTLKISTLPKLFSHFYLFVSC